jgi:hypothetical protein
MVLSFTIAAGPRQRSHSRVRTPRNLWPYFTVLISRLPQLGGSGPGIYIPQEHGDLVITPDTGFPFRRLLLFARLRWMYSNPAGLGSSLYILGADPTENTVSIVIAQQHLHFSCLFIAAGTFLPSRCLAMNVYSGFQASCHNALNRNFFYCECTKSRWERK